MATDPLIVRDGTLPTPFSAAEIRAASTAGTTMVVRTWRQGQGESLRRITFVNCDDDGADREHTELDAGGSPERRVERETWTELQEHACFPVASTTSRRERLATPLGDLDCLRYDVVDGDVTRTFWFDRGRPGMPVRVDAVAAGAVTMRMEIVEHERAGNNAT